MGDSRRTDLAGVSRKTLHSKSDFLPLQEDDETIIDSEDEEWEDELPGPDNEDEDD